MKGIASKVFCGYQVTILFHTHSWNSRDIVRERILFKIHSDSHLSQLLGVAPSISEDDAQVAYIKRSYRAN